MDKHTDKQTNTPTNKQTPLKTSTSLRYATPVDKNTLLRVITTIYYYYGDNMLFYVTQCVDAGDLVSDEGRLAGDGRHINARTNGCRERLLPAVRGNVTDARTTGRRGDGTRTDVV